MSLGAAMCTGFPTRPMMARMWTVPTHLQTQVRKKRGRFCPKQSRPSGARRGSILGRGHH
jgi:hypothetical protein